MSINIINQLSHRLINVIFAIVLILVPVLSGVIYYKANFIAKKNVEVIAEQISVYDLLRKLDNNLIEKERFLYDCYTEKLLEDFEPEYFEANQQAQRILDQLVVRFGDNTPIKVTQDNLNQLNMLADDFLQNIISSQTNWVLARQQLRNISQVRRATSPQIQQLIALTENKVEQSGIVVEKDLTLVCFFVVLYGLLTLILSYIFAKVLKAYLSIAVNNQRISIFSTRNPNPVISLDNKNSVTYCNLATENLLEKLNLEIGNTEVLLAKDIKLYQQQILVDETISSKQFKYQIEQLYFQCELYWLEDQHQWDIHLTDITERKKFEQELQYRASHHLQTGLLNHYELEKSVTLLCKIERKFTFGLIEIRSFSQLISRQGVTVASTVVKEVATSLESILLDMGKTDCSVFYLGEKSFALVCTNYLSNRQIDGLVKKIDVKIASTIFHCQYQLQLDFGFTIYPQHGDDYTQLHKNSLAALDKSASSGDKSHVLFNLQLGDKLHYEQQLIEDMKIAIEAGQFELYFQPQMVIFSKKLIGAEALIR